MVPTAPIASHQLLLLLLQLGLLLTGAILLGRLAVRVGLPAIVGELGVGVLLGPSLFGWTLPGVSHWLFPAVPEQVHLLDAAGQLGVLLLVGLTGIELDMRMVRRQGATAVRVSLAGLVLPLGMGIALGFGLAPVLRAGDTKSVVFVLFLGVAMSVSAIPVIAKTLMDMNLIHRDIGQLTLAAGTVDDAFGWLMLSIVSAMAVGGLTGATIAFAVLSLLLVVVVAVLARPLVRAVLRRCDSPQQTTAAAAAMVVLAAAGTQALGLEAVFGAFVGGILVGTSGEYVRPRTASLRMVVLTVLAPIFFATAGLRVDLRALAQPVVLGAAAAVLSVAIVSKFAGAYLGARLSRLNRWEALALGAGMNARGVVEVVVAMVGLRLGILNSASYTIIVLVAVVTSVMAPPLLRTALKRLQETPEEEARLHAGLATRESGGH
ncbi:hypothetical protein Acy02nite_91240 [Actinoplanes cyaneus]|uniref:Cation/H+ exchanger transmembrane domain-containing protein n=1 Tax=Actinoplanes cyaneus TaxID=52696 RepID=A0A919MB62_9ACTN|nr:cation:proton antiporter [Actinoplanes cyaneus]MCW2144392.1 transporter, CPA2 family [Actinoplanes cyaneus]GID71243.1 hypothetical protein Acy02nite_91240 [Actinoplanes cyaneus]